jgi:hypothetical protein
MDQMILCVMAMVALRWWQVSHFIQFTGTQREGVNRCAGSRHCRQRS